MLILPVVRPSRLPRIRSGVAPQDEEGGNPLPDNLQTSPSEALCEAKPRRTHEDAAIQWAPLRAAPMGSVARPRPEQRLRLGARIFTILAVAERDASGRYLVCFSREEVPA